MTIPEEVKHDVMEDLATLYLAGEATAGTRTLVESYAAGDAGFAARLKKAGRWQAEKPPAPVNRDEETKALLRTKDAIRMRSIFSAMGIAFTALPFSFGFGSAGFHLLFWPDQTGLVSACWSIAAAAWVATFAMHRSLHRRGL
jgi:hypothetical protein